MPVLSFTYKIIIVQNDHITNVFMLNDGSSIILLDIFKLCVYFMWVCAHGCSAWRDQKRALELLQLELTVVMSHWMWVLGANLNSSVIMYIFLTTESSLQSLLKIFYF